MDKLEKMILEYGEVREGNILKVDSFLNHQLNPVFLYQMGEEFYRLFKDKEITKILTIEVSGIAIAVMAALIFKVPVVFAKKTESLNLDKDIYAGKVFSYTKNKEYNIMISKKYLDNNDKVLIIDDFLAEGNAIRGLIDLTKQSKSQIMGIGIAIEKGFQKGGKILRSEGYDLKSLAIVDELKADHIKFRIQQ
jgi:xanthine phosphoribosyltransferase